MFRERNDWFYGVSSDSFSFYDASDKELSASGMRLRQLYNYSTISEGSNLDNDQIYTPQDEGREKKMSVSLEQLQQRRNNEI